MNQILQKDELIKRIDSCLKKTSLPQDIYEPYIARPFQTTGFFDDLSPYIEIDPAGYILIQYERGIKVLHKRTKEADEVVYWILEDTIFLTVYLDMMRQYQVDNIHTHLPNDPSIHKQIVERVHESFRAISGLYEKWHHEGKRASIETPAKK
ncbi:Imm63 family immunity protein [Bacillus altitudinis]|uniref:Imm63 family immunity protein n=1 Tax=Bacillus altitudinis TaxID=293387 RepID=UPI0022830344|nr:Imm63 family immunity protein [Bacillus altitudinis]MCY7453785.1 immunity 63 family protein [Bacillus altitudinis]